METIKTFKKGNQEYRIVVDDYPESPRDFDNLGIIIHWHSKYRLGDETLPKGFDNNDKIKEWLEENRDAEIILPVYIYDHSGITISTKPFSCMWDSGLVGYIYTTKENILTWFDKDILTKKLIAHATKILEAEIEQFDNYLTNNVYLLQLIEYRKCHTCGHTEEHVVETSSGFYGDIEKSGILEEIPTDFEEVN